MIIKRVMRIIIVMIMLHCRLLSLSRCIYVAICKKSWNYNAMSATHRHPNDITKLVCTRRVSKNMVGGLYGMFPVLLSEMNWCWGDCWGYCIRALSFTLLLYLYVWWLFIMMMMTMRRRIMQHFFLLKSDSEAKYCAICNLACFSFRWDNITI